MQEYHVNSENELPKFSLEEIGHILYNQKKAK